MVRFVNGTPSYIALSAHDRLVPCSSTSLPPLTLILPHVLSGTAYTYSALQQTGGRATTYIAGGSHANYATAGKQDYGAPFGLLSDTTDAGPYWDVTQVSTVRTPSLVPSLCTSSH